MCTSAAGGRALPGRGSQGQTRSSSWQWTTCRCGRRAKRKHACVTGCVHAAVLEARWWWDGECAWWRGPPGPAGPMLLLAARRGGRQKVLTAGAPCPAAPCLCCPPQPAYGETLVDMSCGSGLFTRRFLKSNRFAGVVAADFRCGGQGAGRGAMAGCCCCCRCRCCCCCWWGATRRPSLPFPSPCCPSLYCLPLPLPLLPPPSLPPILLTPARPLPPTLPQRVHAGTGAAVLGGGPGPGPIPLPAAARRRGAHALCHRLRCVRRAAAWRRALPGGLGSGAGRGSRAAPGLRQLQLCSQLAAALARWRSRPWLWPQRSGRPAAPTCLAPSPAGACNE